MDTPRRSLLGRLHNHFLPHKGNGYVPGFFSASSIAVLVLAVFVFEAGYLFQTQFVFLKTDFLASVLPGALVALTNQDRAAAGITGVTEAPLLDQAAQAAANDMAANGYFAHVSPSGKTPWYWLNQVGYRYSYAGENLAVNFTDSSAVETAWMDSPTHRANIEKPQYTEVGIGTANGVYQGALATFVVQFFATPASQTTSQVAIVSSTPKPVRRVPSTSAVTTTVSALPEVLGTETTAPAVAAAAAPSSGLLNHLTALLLSPSSALQAVLDGLLVLVAIVLAVVLATRRHLAHPRAIISGIALILFILAALFLNSALSRPVIVPPFAGVALVTPAR